MAFWRILVGISENTRSIIPFSARNYYKFMTTNSTVVQVCPETEFSRALHQTSLGNEEQPQLGLDLATCTDSNVVMCNGGETVPISENQRGASMGEVIGQLGCPYADGGNLHCFDTLGLILCPYVYSPEDIQISVAELAVNENDKKSVKTFRLPPDALWYPKGTHLRDEDMVCSVFYSEVENEVLEKFRNRCSKENKSSLLPTTISPSSLVYGRLSEDRAMDMTVFMKDVSQERLMELQCSVLSSVEKPDPTGKPSAEQLSHVFNELAEALPKLFIQPTNYKIYSSSIVFENRIRGKVTVGIVPYIKQVALLRTVGHLKFAYVRFQILKITKHPEDGTIRVRWQIRGISGLKAMIEFMRVKLLNWKSVKELMDSWYDGYSTFYVGGDGLIHKHVADSMMPDEEKTALEKGPLAAKLAALLGLAHRPNLGDASSKLPFDVSSLLLMHKEDEETYSQLMLPLERIQ